MLLQKTFFGKVKKNSSKWIKSSENIKYHENRSLWKKKYSKLSQKKLRASKKNFVLGKISNIFFYEMGKKIQKKIK